MCLSAGGLISRDDLLTRGGGHLRCLLVGRFVGSPSLFEDLASAFLHLVEVLSTLGSDVLDQQLGLKFIKCFLIF